MLTPCVSSQRDSGDGDKDFNWSTICTEYQPLIMPGICCLPWRQSEKYVEPDLDPQLHPHAKLKKENSKRSKSILGNFVKEFEGSVWDAYEQLPGSKLGRGAGGEVVEASHKKNNRKYAVKIINISNPKYHSLIENEKTILQDLDHLNCVRLYEVYSIGLTQMWFVLELCTGGHLGQHIAAKSRGYLCESRAKVFATQLVSVIAHCHERKICHRDVKLANILMETKTRDTELKLIDFGNSSRFKSGTLMNRIAGTTYSTAPEVFQRKGYDERCDVWSIGVMVYIMLAGRRPFERIDIPSQPEASEASLISSILLGRYHFNHAPFRDVSDEAIHFICTCFEPYGQRRISAEKLMHHPWLKHDAENLSRDPLSVIDASIDNRLDLGSRNLGSESLSGDMAVSNAQSQANYARRTDFNRTSMLGVAFSIPPQKTRMIRKVFSEMDTDNTGFIDRTEFFEAVKRSTAVLPGIDFSGDVNALFDMIDIDGNGQLCFLEFLAATIDPRSVDVQDMNHAFKLLDKEEKGYITVADLESILRTRSKPGSRRNSNANHKDGDIVSEARSKDDIESSNDAEAQMGAEHRAVQELQHMKELEQSISRMIAEVDVDGDGRINYSEFLFAMSELPQNTNFVPHSLNDVLQNEQYDEMHKQRHLKRAKSDLAAHRYSTSQQPTKNKDELGKEDGASAGIFSRLAGKKLPSFGKANDPMQNRSDTAPAGHMSSPAPSKSSNNYFSQNHRNQNKVHADIAWTKPVEKLNISGDINSANNINTIKTGHYKSPVPTDRKSLEQNDHSM